jgi:hypothetical protein
MVTLLDLEIAHLARVMGASMIGDLAGPILPAACWRGRLHQLLDSQHLTNGQLRSLDNLLLQLDLKPKSRIVSPRATNKINSLRWCHIARWMIHRGQGWAGSPYLSLRNGIALQRPGLAMPS